MAKIRAIEAPCRCCARRASTPRSACRARRSIRYMPPCAKRVASITCWRVTSKAPRTWRTVIRARRRKHRPVYRYLRPRRTDMITGLYAAWADSIPILCVTGQAPRARLYKEDFQAVDIESIARPVTMGRDGA